MGISLKEVLETYKSKKHGKIALSRYRYLFPLKFSIKLAGIVADLTGDGHLQDYPKYRLDYCSKDINELKRFEKEIKSLFGVGGKIRKSITNKWGTSFNIGINCKPLARILKLCGTPTGSKVLKEFKIPNWILNNKLFFRRYVDRLFSCEACVDTYSKAIELKMNKSIEKLTNGVEFFEQLKSNLYKYFKIKTTNIFLEGKINVRKDGIKTQGIRLKIKNKISLQRYYKEVRFEDKIKQKKLNKIII